MRRSVLGLPRRLITGSLLLHPFGADLLSQLDRFIDKLERKVRSISLWLIVVISLLILAVVFNTMDELRIVVIDIANESIKILLNYLSEV